MDILLFSITTIAPTFIIILTGVFLKKIRIINDDSCGYLSGLVFNLLLPALILKTIAQMDKNSSFTYSMVLSLLIFYFGTITIAWLAAGFMGIQKGVRGFFMTGATFGNNAIIGYAFGDALYGEAGIARAAILSAILMPLSIFFSGLMLNRTDTDKSSRHAVRDFALSMVKNPVMLSLLAGIIIWQSPFEVPDLGISVLTMLGQAALPVALISIGGSLQFNMNKGDYSEISATTVLKLLVMPALALLASLLLNLTPEATGSLLLMAACPSSISYYVMARNQGHSSSKGAGVVTATTVSSAFTAALIAAYLRHQGWV
ncbi:MAG: AEC family transporter [Spirochaetales bacterium]|nr:AEC family transporter [Spirochaetales bacterium]